MDIFTEIAREQKYNKRSAWVKQNIVVLTTVTIIIIISLSLYYWNQNQRLSHNLQMGDNLIKIINTKYTNETPKQLEYIIANSKNSIAEIASIEEVKFLYQQNNIPGALSKLTNLINNKNYHTITRSYGKILWLSIALNAKELDLSKEKELYLADFKDENQVFFGTASILKALWCLKDKQPEKAQLILKKIIDIKHLPHIIKNEAKTILGNIK